MQVNNQIQKYACNLFFVKNLFNKHCLNESITGPEDQ